MWATRRRLLPFVGAALLLLAAALFPGPPVFADQDSDDLSADPGAPSRETPWFVREVPAIIFDRASATWEGGQPAVSRALWVWAEQWTGPDMPAAGPPGTKPSSEYRFADTKTYVRLNDAAGPVPQGTPQTVWLPVISLDQFRQMEERAAAEPDPGLRALMGFVIGKFQSHVTAYGEASGADLKLPEEWGVPLKVTVRGPASLSDFDRQQSGVTSGDADYWRALLGNALLSVDGNVVWHTNSLAALPLFYQTVTNPFTGRIYKETETWKGSWREPWWDANPDETSDPGIPAPGFYRGRNWHSSLHDWAKWVPGVINSLSGAVDAQVLYQGQTWEDRAFVQADILAEPGADVEIPLVFKLVVEPPVGSEGSGSFEPQAAWGSWQGSSAEAVQWLSGGEEKKLSVGQDVAVSLRVNHPPLKWEA